MYFKKLYDLIENVSVSNNNSKKTDNKSLDHVLKFIENKIKLFKPYNKIILIGNGGSSAIANHLANDFNKNAKIKALSFSDSASLTCLANDYGYENIYLKSLEFHSMPGDILFAISSSGNSKNILKATKYALKNNITTLTFSGFNKSNSLRKLGHYNIYINDNNYGHVELCHFNICHFILDYFYQG